MYEFFAFKEYFLVGWDYYEQEISQEWEYLNGNQDPPWIYFKEINRLEIGQDE